MKAPTTGTGYGLEGYGIVLVKSGPSPEHPYVICQVGYDGSAGEPIYEEIHIDEFWDRWDGR